MKEVIFPFYDSNINMNDEDGLFLIHTATTDIELEIVFRGKCDLRYEFGKCDNLKLTIWHRNYTL
jgi:hypothetical protein